jgi:hypothetical protein
MTQKYYFYIQNIDKSIVMAENLTKRQAVIRYNSFSRNPTDEAQAYGWAAEDNSLQHQIRCKKATESKIVLAF